MLKAVKKTLSLLLCAALMLTMMLTGFPGLLQTAHAAGEFSEGDGSAANPYIVRTAEQLAALNNYRGRSYDNTHFRLGNDIDLTEYLSGRANGWSPIGGNGIFYGEFDGNGHTVSGLWLRNTYGYAGLFNITVNNTIQNVTVITDEAKGITATGGGTGVLAGRSQGTDFIKCSVYGFVEGVGYVGGMVGYALRGSDTGVDPIMDDDYAYGPSKPGSIVDCFSAVNVKGQAMCGGIAGASNVPAVERCRNVGSVTGTGDGIGNNGGSAGGIAGGAVSISQCRNTGKVTGAYLVGGIVGEIGIWEKNKSGSITQCYNTGSVFGDRYTGGIAGMASDSSITQCYNTGKVSAIGISTGGLVGYHHSASKVEFCYNTGEVQGWDTTGGLVGYVETRSVVSRSYNAATVTGSGQKVGNLVGWLTPRSSVTNCYWNLDKEASGVSKDIGVRDNGATVQTDNKNTNEFVHPSTINSSGGDADLTHLVDWANGVNPWIKRQEESSSCGCGGTIAYYPELSFFAVDDYDAEKRIASRTSAIGRTSGTPLPADEEPFYDDGTIFRIYTDKQMNHVRAHLWANYSLQANINLSAFSDGNGWEPIDNFTGFFDGNSGNGYSISGLRIYRPEAEDAGLFGLNTGTIFGLDVQANEIYGGIYTGGIAARNANNGVIQGCRYSGAPVWSQYYVGGIAGQNYFATIDNCNHLSGNVFSSLVHSGGIVGWNEYGTVQNSVNGAGTVYGHGNGGAIGGIVGYNSHGTIAGCRNYSTDVNGNYTENQNHVGGIVGRTNGGTIRNSANMGAAIGRDCVGGIFGNGNAHTVTACYNNGTVSGTRNVGGIGGLSTGSVQESFNMGTVSGNENVGGVVGANDVYESNIGKIENCYNTGSLSSGGTSVGGIAGYRNGSDTVTGSYSATKINGTLVTNGQNVYQMTKADALATLGLSDTIWTKRANTTDEWYYPELKTFYAENPETEEQTASHLSATTSPERFSPSLQISPAKQADGSVIVTVTLSGAAENYNQPIAVKVSLDTDGDIYSNTLSTDASGVVSFTLESSVFVGSVGPYKIEADYTGNAFINNPAYATSNYYQNKSPQAALTIVNPGVKTYGDQPFQLATTGGSGDGDITYSVSAGTGGTVTEDGVVTITGAGFLRIMATKEGDALFNSISVVIDINFNKKPVTIIDVAAADKPYDGSTAAVISTAAASISGNIDGGNLTIDAGNASAAFENVNAASGIAVHFSGFALGGDAANNYQLSAQPASAEAAILPAVLTVTPNDNQSKYYGEADPVLTYGYSGNAGNELPGFTGELSRETGEEAGETYNILQNSLALADGTYGFLAANYTLSFVPDVTFSILSYDPAEAAELLPNGPGGWFNSDADEVTLTAPAGFEISATGADPGYDWQPSLSLDISDGENKTAGYYLKNTLTGAISILKSIEYKVDTTAPTATVQYKTNGFKAFLNTVTFGLFFKDNVDVSIQASDALSGVAKVEYHRAEAEVDDYTAIADWTEDDSFNIAQNEKFILYVRVTDNAGNRTYYSDGVVAYTDSESAVNGGSFFKASDSDLAVSVVMNGNTVKEIRNGAAVLAPGTDYTAGTDIITFKNAYLKNLADGMASFTVSYYPAGETGTLLGDSEAPGTTIVSVSVNRTNQNITITGLGSGYVYGHEDFRLSTSGGLGSGAVTYEVVEGTDVASVNGDIVTIRKAGAFKIKAVKAADAVYSEASYTSGAVTVSEATPTITVEGADIAYGQDVVLNITVSGAGITPDGMITVKEDDDVLAADIPLVNGEASYAVTIPDAGNHTYEVVFAGQAGYYTAAAGTKAVGVGLSDQAPLSITGKPALVTYGDSQFTLGTGGGSGTGSVAFSVPNEEVISVTADGTVTVHNAGTVTVTATKAGDDNYNAATATTEITVMPRDIGLVNVTVTGDTVYTGSQIQPLFTVSDERLAIDTGDYTNAYGENVTVAQGGSITLTGQRNYTGTKTVDFSIAKAIPPAVVFPEPEPITYSPSMTLADVPLIGSGDGVFTWEDDSVVLTVGDNSYKVIFTPADSANYDYTGVEMSSIVTLTVTEQPKDPQSYSITAGADQSWKKGTATGITITCDGDTNDFEGLKIDGVTVDESNYTAEPGSTVVTLKPEFLETLDLGAHTLEFIYSDGSAQTSLTVLQAEEETEEQTTPPTKEETETPTTPPTEEETETPTVPPTGDNGMAAVWILLMAVSLAGIGVTVVTKRIGKRD